MDSRDAPKLTRFSAQLSYRTASGFGCTVGFNGRLGTPQDALMCALHELALVAERSGLGDLAIDAVTTRVNDVRAALQNTGADHG